MQSRSPLLLEVMRRYLKPKKTKMKNSIKLIGSLLLLSTFLISCKKEYACVCSNVGGPVETFTIKNTKKKAQDECQEYYKEHYDYYWSESFCEIK